MKRASRIRFDQFPADQFDLALDAIECTDADHRIVFGECEMKGWKHRSWQLLVGRGQFLIAYCLAAFVRNPGLRGKSGNFHFGSIPSPALPGEVGWINRWDRVGALASGGLTALGERLLLLRGLRSFG